MLSSYYSVLIINLGYMFFIMKEKEKKLFEV